MKWHTIADEAGARRAVATISGASDLPPEHRWHMERCRHPRWLAWAGYTWIAGFVGLILLTIVEHVGVPGQLLIWPKLFFAVPAAVGMCMTTVVLPLREFLGSRSRAMAREWKRLGRCPWCAYQLPAASQQENGIVLCSECGGLWRITPPTSPVSPPAARCREDQANALSRR
jgi:hypothetical protein